MSYDFDYKGWVDDIEREIAAFSKRTGRITRRFSRRPPSTTEELAEACRSLKIKLPESLKNLYLQGASDFEFKYLWHPDKESTKALMARTLDGSDRVYGNFNLTPPCALGSAYDLSLEFIEDMGDRPADFNLDLRRLCIPFFLMESGDCLGISTEAIDGEYPIVLMCFYSFTWIVSPSLPSFCHEWRRMHFLGPDHICEMKVTDDEAVAYDEIFADKELPKPPPRIILG